MEGAEAAVSPQVKQGAAPRGAEPLRAQSAEALQRRGAALKLSVFPRRCRFDLLLLVSVFIPAPCVLVLTTCCRSEEDSEGNRDICSEILQMKALERLTSTVRRHSRNFGLFPTRKTNKLGFLFASIANFFFCFVFFRNRYKVSWQQLWPGRLAKLVSVFLLTKKKNTSYTLTLKKINI